MILDPKPNQCVWCMNSMGEPVEYMIWSVIWDGRGVEIVSPTNRFKRTRTQDVYPTLQDLLIGLTEKARYLPRGKKD